MTPQLRITEGAYFRDILDQPRALAQTHRGLEATAALEDVARRLRDGDLRRVVLTGMGSSHLGLVPLHLRLVEAGLAPVSVESSELLHYQRRLLSRGHAARARLAVRPQRRDRAAARDGARARGRHDRPHEHGRQPARARGDRGRAHAAREKRRPSRARRTSRRRWRSPGWARCWRAAIATPRERRSRRRSPPRPRTSRRGASHVEWLAERLQGVRAVYYTGRGPSLAAACSAGLITKESTHRPSEGMSSAAFRHGPMEMLDEDVFLLAFAGAARTRGLNEALVADVRAAGARAFLAAEDAPEAGPAPARGPRRRPPGRRAPAGRDDHPRPRGPRRPRGRPLRAGHEDHRDGVTLVIPRDSGWPGPEGSAGGAGNRCS